MSDWTSVDTKLFADCTAQMKNDEIIYNDLFNSRKAMKSITFGSNRCDSHAMAEGMHDINDFIAKGNYLPDENITTDEIRKIQGRVLDCMVARFDGYNLFQTVLTCVYVHRSYTIKNPLLKLVIYPYVYVIEVVEEFVNKYKTCTGYSWANDGGIGLSYLPEKSTIDPIALRNELVKAKESDPSVSDIVNFSLFMLDFSEYLLDFQTKEIPELPELPKESSPIGFSDVLQNRRLSTSAPPTLIQILPHDKSIERLVSMINNIKEFKDIQKPTSVLGIINFLYEWTTHNSNAVILCRVVLNAIFFPGQPDHKTNIIDCPSCKEFLISEFKTIHITDKIFAFDKEVTIDSTVFNFLAFYVRSFLMPIGMAQSSLEKQILQFWIMIQDYLISSLSKTAKLMSFPKTDSESMNNLVENPMLNWAIHITTQLVKIYLELGIKCKIYDDRDYLQIFLFLSVVHKGLKNIYHNEKLVTKVYEAASFQGSGKGKKKPISSSNVNKRMGEESNKEIEEQIIADYYEYSVYLMQFVIKTKSIKLYSNEFFYPKNVYEERKAPLHRVPFLQFIEYENFDVLYNPNHFQIPHIQNSIKNKANQVKESIKKLISRPDSPGWVKDILKKTVQAQLAIAQWKEGDTFTITFDDDCLPNFQLVKH